MTSSSSDCKSSLQQDNNVGSTSQNNHSNYIVRDAMRFRSIFDHAAVEILLLDAKTLNVNLMNSYAKVQLGYTDDDVNNLSFETICFVEDDSFENVLDDLLSNRIEKCLFYAKLFRKDGSSYPAKLEFFNDSHFRESGFVVWVRDITQRMKQQELLEKSRDELQLIFDNAPARIWRKDNNNRYLKVNKAAAKQLGKVPEELEGVYPAEVLEGYEEKFLQLDNEVLRTGIAKLGIETRTAYDFNMWERVDIVPVKGSHEDANGLLVICTDITKQKEAEIKLESVIQELEAANERLEQFNALVSHDLRAPLRHMRMLSELLLVSVEEGTEAHSYATDIHQNASQGQAMIGALNALSQVSRKALSRSDLDLSTIVSQIENRLEDELEYIGGKIVYGNLPVISADAELVVNVFQNLIENAIRYRSDRPLEIRIGVDLSDGKEVFCVADNGRGIDRQFSHEIFQIFTRLEEGTEAAPQGQGVGLSICRKIIERHGGEIWLDDSYENGACFKFTLS